MNAKISVFKNDTVNAEETEVRIHVTYYFLSAEDDQGPGDFLLYLSFIV